MEREIEWSDLDRMGASDEALDFFATTDPLHIYQTDAGYLVTGTLEWESPDEAHLLKTLDTYAKA